MTQKYKIKIPLKFNTIIRQNRTLREMFPVISEKNENTGHFLFQCQKCDGYFS